jgi:two-component system, sensor histidine kinase YesM
MRAALTGKAASRLSPRTAARSSLAQKIILTCILIVGASLLLCDVVAYEYFRAILKQQYVDSAKAQLATVSRQFNYIANDIEKVAVTEALDPDIQRFLRGPIPEDAYERYSTKSYLSRKLSMFAVQRDYLISLTVIKADDPITDDDLIMSAVQTDFGIDARSFREMLGESWYTRMPKDRRDFYSTPITLKLLHSDVEIVPYLLNIADMEAPDSIIGKVVLFIRYDYLKKAFESFSAAGEYGYWLDTAGNFLSADEERSSSEDLRAIAKGARGAKEGASSSLEDSSGYLLVDKTMRNGWTFASAIPYASIWSKLRSILYFFFAYTAVILAVTYAVLLPIMLGIVRPLSQLSQAMRQVSGGDLGVEIEVKAKDDEVGYLALCFEEMLADINEHIRKEAEYESTEKRMQLELLLAQINPHFIYNTLQTIVYMAKRKGAEDIAEMTTSFIGVLQDIVRISDGGLTTTIGQELELLKQYLTIQHYRYGDRFVVNWQVDEGLGEVRVPRSVLQPIVENALGHGILSTPRTGIIDISIRRSADSILVEIRDNGVGIDGERLRELLSAEDGRPRSEGMRSIGLRNVNERIKYICGQEYGLAIDSALGEYTRVILTLPAEL